jgi:hypothetical protein
VLIGVGGDPTIQEEHSVGANFSRRHFVQGLFAGLFAFLKPRPAAAAGTQPSKPKDARESLSKPHDSQGGETFVWGETTSCSYDGSLPEGPAPLMTVTTYNAFGGKIVYQSVLKQPLS